MKRLFLISIAGLMCFAPSNANAQKLPMASETDRILRWYSHPDRTGQTVTGLTRFIVKEDNNQSFSKITSWCIYLNDTLLPWTKPTGYAQVYIYYDRGLVSREDNAQDSVGCWNTTAIETSQQGDSYERSYGFDITIDTALWQNGTNSFKIEATTALGARFSKSATVTSSNFATTTTTTTTTIPKTIAPSITNPIQPGSTAAVPTTNPRIGVWIDPPVVTNLSAESSDKVTSSQISVLVGNSTLIVIKYGVKGKGTFKTKKIQLAEGINYFPAESRAEFTLSGLSPKTLYNGSVQSSGPSGKSGLATFSFKSSAIPSKTKSGGSTSSGRSSGSSSSGGSGYGYSSVIGWRLDRALSTLGWSRSQATEYYGCPNKTWLGIVNLDNWIVVVQTSNMLYACKP